MKDKPSVLMAAKIDQIVEELKEHGVSVADICKEVGVSYTTLQNYRDGISKVPGEVFLKLEAMGGDQYALSKLHEFGISISYGIRQLIKKLV